MMRKLLTVFVTVLFSLVINAQEIILKKGMVIKKTGKVKRAIYRIDAYDSLNKAPIIIEGNDITIDFNKVVLKGSAGKTSPDEFFGTAIFIKRGKNITIKNLTAKGYKVALMAEGVEALKLENCDFSYNYRRNTKIEEDMLMPGWSFFHNNESDVWLYYGAAIYLRNCQGAIVKNCRVTNGFNSLVLTNCDKGEIYNNDFSFNSGVGIGMFRCNGNRILFNKLNFNVSAVDSIWGKWQASAGVMVFDQSNYNVFYKNSVTHCGDAFFLGATYEELWNIGNRIWSNDLSFSQDCGIELGYNSCSIYDNRFYECEEGIRGKGAYNSTIASNKFRKCLTAIDLRNSQAIEIEGNIFQGDMEAIKLSYDHMVSSLNSKRYLNRGYVIHVNSFNQNPLVYNFSHTDSIRIFNNRYAHVDEIFRIDSTVTNIDSLPVESIDTAMGFPFVKDPANPFKGSAKFAGRDKIMLTEWGPYDFQYPFIWNTNQPDSSGFMDFDVLGPKGKWKIVSTNGVEVTGMSADSFPSRVNVQVLGKPEDTELILEYIGPAFTDQFGNRIPANKPYRFSFKKIKLKTPVEQIPKGPFFQKY